MRDDVAPVRFARRIARGGDDLEVARVPIGAEIEAVAVIHHVVEEARPPGLDEKRLQRRRVEIDDMGLGGVVAMNGDQRRAAEPRPLDADEPGGVRLGEDLDVLVLLRPEPVQHHPERPMALILLDIEKALQSRGSRRCRRSH